MPAERVRDRAKLHYTIRPGAPFMRFPQDGEENAGQLFLWVKVEGKES